MKKSIIGKFLLSTIVLPSFMNGFTHIYAASEDGDDSSKSEALEVVRKAPQDSSIFPSTAREVDEKLKEASLATIEICITNDGVLDLSDFSIHELSGHIAQIEECVKKRKEINSIKLSHKQIYQNVIWDMESQRCSKGLPDIITKISHIAEKSKISICLDYIMPLAPCTFCDKDFWGPTNSGYSALVFDYLDPIDVKLNCNAILIHKIPNLSIEKWLEYFYDYFYSDDCKSVFKRSFWEISPEGEYVKKVVVGKSLPEMIQIKRIVSCGSPLTNDEKQKIQEFFKKKCGISDLIFQEDLSANCLGVGAHQHPTLHPEFTLRDGKKTKLDEEHLYEVLSHLQYMDYSKDRFRYAGGGINDRLCDAFPLINKKSTEVDKSIRTLNMILDKKNSSGIINYILNRKKTDRAIYYIIMSYDLLRDSTILPKLKILKEAGIREITLDDSAHGDSYDWFGSKHVKEFLETCKNLDIQVMVYEKPRTPLL